MNAQAPCVCAKKMLNPLDPGDLPSNMRYSLKITPTFRATMHIQSLTNAHIFIKTKSFLLRFKGILGLEFGWVVWVKTPKINSPTWLFPTVDSRTGSFLEFDM